MSHEGFNEIEGNDQGRVEKDKSSGERSQKCMSWLVLTWDVLGSLGMCTGVFVITEVPDRRDRRCRSLQTVVPETPNKLPPGRQAGHGLH